MVADAAVANSAAEVRVGTVLSRTFSVAGRNALIFLLASSVINVPSLLVTLNVGVSRAGPNLLSNTVLSTLAATGASAVLLSPLMQAVINYMAFEDLCDRPVAFLTALGRGLRCYFPLVMAYISLMVVLFFGFLLLLVPGIIFALWFSVIGPACVVERLGPFAALGRSRHLTKGYRGKVFGLFLIVWVAAVVVGGIEFKILPILGAGSIGFFAGGRFVLQTLLGTFTATLFSVLYYELRMAREGVFSSRFASVFD
jgi:hypothetical protein